MSRNLLIFAAGLVLGGLLIWLLMPTGPAEPTSVPEPDQPLLTAPTAEKDAFDLTRAQWADLPGWAEDDQAIALKTFNISCAALLKMSADTVMDGADFAGTAEDWHPVCELALFAGQDTEAARAFFENAFVPFAVSENGKPEGLFTGYYVPLLQGRLKKDATFDGTVDDISIKEVT